MLRRKKGKEGKRKREQSRQELLPRRLRRRESDWRRRKQLLKLRLRE